MNQKSLLIGLIPLLLLVGCAAEKPTVSILMKEPRPYLYCPKHEKDSNGKTGTGGFLVCDWVPSEKDGWMKCIPIPADKDGCYNQKIPDYRTMSAEEFTFKYDHDPSFKASIQSYQFSR